MNNTLYDMVVIGAGIHGAGVAQAAAAAGYSVLVVEKTSIAGGTSSRSSKLIHGGLRYLESGQFGLVHECLLERSRLLRLASGLVHLTPHFLPVYRYTRRRPWKLRLGLTLYALLGQLEESTRFARVPRREWSSLDGLVTDGLQVVYRYWDAQTDDTALTYAVISSARKLGAELAIPAEITSAQFDGYAWTVKLRTGDIDSCCRGLVLVNAAGPWVNTVRERLEPVVTPRRIELVQGTHLILAGRLQRGVYYTEAPSDGRAVFVMPWRGDQILVGTTETPFHGQPEDVRPLQEEREYLLDTLCNYFPAFRSHFVIDAFAGLRVLPVADGTHFGRARDAELDLAVDGRLVTIYGGKLTAYRSTAGEVMRKLIGVLPPREAIADTEKLMLGPVV